MTHFASFRDMIKAFSAAKEPYTLLYVFLRVNEMTPETRAKLFPQSPDGAVAGSVEIVFDAHQPVHAGLTFESIVANADAHDSNWQMVGIASAHNRDGSPVSEAQANAFLGDMRKNIATGNAGNVGFFDRKGQHLAPFGVRNFGPPGGGAH